MANEYINNKLFEVIIQDFQAFKRRKKKYELLIEDLREVHKRRTLKYKDNIKEPPLDEKIQKYNEVCQSFDVCQIKLAKDFYILSQNIANYSKFNGIDIDDAIQEGVVICFEKVDRFNPNYRGKNGQKPKAFNYMTTCVLNHFRQLYRSAKSHQELTRKYKQHLQESHESVFFVNGKEKINYN